MAQFAIDEILTTGIAISGFVFDVSNNIGANGYVLTSTSSGVMWQADSNNADLSLLSGQIAATGTLLNNRINSLSGYVNGTFLSGSGVANYVARWSNTKELLTGSIYDLGTGIGIGTTSPAAKLEVKGADDAVITAIFQSFAGNPAYNGGIQLGNAVANQNSQIYHSSAGDNTLTFVSNYSQGTANKFIFAPGGTETVRFQQNGRVGIGTASPTTLLSVGGAGSTSAASGVTFGGDAQANLYRYTEDTLKTDGALIAGTYLRALDYVQLLTNIYPDSYTDYLRLNVGNSAGNAWENYPVVIKRGVYVGIGTDTPSGKLHVVSSIAGETVLRADGTNGTLFSVTDDLSDSLMSVNNSAGLPVFEVFADDRVVAGQYGSGDFVLVNNKVGIGTTNPTYKLHVLGDTLISGNLTNPTIIGLSGALNITGSTLDTKINTLSGYSNANFATILNLAVTGSTLDTKINTTNTNLAATGSTLDTKINTLSGYSNANFATILNLAATGSTLDTKINTTNTNLAATGSTLDTKINTLSGYAGSTFLSGVGVSNYVPRWSGTKQLVTGNLYDNGTNVGIGTNNPISKFVVNGGNVNTVTYTTSEARIADGSLHLMKTAAGGIFESIRAMNMDTTAGTTVRFLAASTSDPFNNANGGKVFIDAIRTATNMDLAFSLNDVAGAAPVERVRFMGNGYVGIGTTQPLNRLSVISSNSTNYYNTNAPVAVFQGVSPSTVLIAVDGNVDGYYSELKLGNAEGTYYPYSAYIRGIQGAGIDYYRMEFGTSNGSAAATRMTIANNGNIGIGITNPSNKLHISGGGISFTTSTGLAVPMIGIVLPTNIAYIGPYATTTDGNAPSTVAFNHGTSVQQTWFYSSGRIAMVLNKEGRLNIAGNAGNTPPALLNVGPASSVDAVSGMSFGNDSSANLYRSAAGALKTDGSLGIGINPVQKLQVDGAVGNPALNGTTQSGIFRISNTTDNAVLDFGIRAGGLGAWIQSTDETSLSATYPLLLNPNGGSVGIGITNPSGQLHLRNMGFTNQDTVPDTNLFPNASGVFGLVMDHDAYTNGLYRHRFIKVDRSANVPLYLQQAGGVAHQYINLVRFGTHSQSTDTFEVFGDSRINGSVNVTSTLSTSGSINIGTDLYVSGQLGVGVPIANKRLNYGAEIKANNFSIQLVLGRIGAVSGLGAIGADANNTFAVWNVSGQTTRQFVVTQQGNVGIGSASPVSRLDVNGTIALSGYSFADRFAVYNRVWNPELPSIYLGDSSDPTNYYDNTTHIFRARGAGAERMRITTAGNVGIGSESPTQKLDVSGTLKIKSAGTYSDPTDNAGFLNYDTVGGIFTLSARSNAGNTYMAFRTSNGGTGSEKVRITNNGLVGISSNAPTDFLDFGGAGKNIVFGYAAYGEVLNSAASIIGNNVKASPTANSQVRRFASANDQGNFIKLIYNKGVTFHTNITSALNTDISEDTNERMRIDLSGNVGIGTTGPTFKLSVQGIAQARGGVYVTQATPTNTLVLDADSTSLHKIYTNSTVDLSLGTNSSTTQVYLKDGGNVGIGTTDPTNKLQVVGQIAIKGDESADNAKMYFQASDNSNRYTVETDLDGDTNNDLLIFRSNTVDNMLVLKGNGNVGIGVANPACKLDVAGTIRSSTNEIYGFGASDNVSLRAASTLNVLGIYTSNVERLRLAANGYFGVGTDNPSTLLSVGRAGSTLPASGLTFGGDAEANLYRSAEDTIKTDGSLIVAGNVTATNLVSGNGTANYITKWNGTKSIANSQIFDDGTYVGVNTAVNTTYRLQVNGSFAATTKSFDIVHPTISGKRLIYASLEGPENGVYFRGKNDNNEINLPHYWSGLVHDDSITVDLTSVGKRKDGKIRNYTVDQIGHNKVYIYTDSDDNIYDYYYTIFAERRDVSRLITERDME